MNELHLPKNLERYIVFVEEFMGNFFWGVGEGRIVKKKLLFDLLEPEEEIYATVTIKF